MVSFPPVSPPRPYTPPSPHPYAPHAQPISFFSMISPAQYWVSSTNHLASRCAISSIPPLQALPVTDRIRILDNKSKSAVDTHTHTHTHALVFLQFIQPSSYLQILQCIELSFIHLPSQKSFNQSINQSINQSTYQ